MLIVLSRKTVRVFGSLLESAVEQILECVDGMR
jgi:hypothetical protein